MATRSGAGGRFEASSEHSFEAPLGPERSSRKDPAGPAAREQLAEVVDGGHEQPFGPHLLQPAQTEAPEAARFLDLAKDRLDDRLAPRVVGAAPLRPQLA